MVEEAASRIFMFLTGCFTFLLGPLNQRIVYLCVLVVVNTILYAHLDVREHGFSLRRIFMHLFTKAYWYFMIVTALHAADMIIFPESQIIKATGMPLVVYFELETSYKKAKELGHNDKAAVLTEVLKTIQTGGSRERQKDVSSQEDGNDS